MREVTPSKSNQNLKIENHVGLRGIEFIEYAAHDPRPLEELFGRLGLEAVANHLSRRSVLFEQNDIHFILTSSKTGFSATFADAHGPSVCAMGWKVDHASEALKKAIARGAKDATAHGDYKDLQGKPIPAIFGIGDSLIYFLDNFNKPECYQELGFEKRRKNVKSKSGFQFVDHLTNNVPNGTMEYWSDFYKNIFGFVDFRHFDIKGKKTGLQSYALRSPCGTFCIPINEAKDEKSQINEYLREYKGAGVQHIALSTENIVESVGRLRGQGVRMLDVEASYYDEVFERVPNVTEEHTKLQDLGILVDGDEEGYLLQIFTQNVIGPIFFEIIQRKNHLSFGEGNFGALFRSIEIDQECRGVL